MIINGDIFSLAKKKQAFLQLNDRTLNLGNAELNLKFTVNANVFSPDTINQFVKNKEIVFYNHVWGSTSLTPYDRQEIVVDKDFMITNIVDHGDNAIPAQGWILSFPKSQILPPLKIGQKMALDVNFNSNTDQNNPQWQGAENIVMGIPLLVKDGQVVPDLDSTHQKDFVMLPHARTAIGIQSNDTVVMVVVEHVYKQSLGKMPLEQARNILHDKQYSKEKLETLPVSEMCSIIQNELASQSNVIGLPLPDLAKLMVDLKCVQAINLDGGGSSTLFLNGQVKNLAVGDADEAMGQKTLRPVSNAIVVVKRD
ncbi:MAG TPA: phosphodiester glycosidase family protein [Gammaproteobacteria bacterium]|nr:phosphodiester glycosidase family protein [Gammaproteobacteria bacterium]